ncbi:hypothetical protein FNU76_19405 [Chitinimonas arctica]|uniref:Uncharacterized protein n=1 Tax=Chitinimonas arctica TaxID=2594795 RepID=A0A516SJN4_9NEIS|nr:hypothetical protein [Chitinimonas arctica]QDQ28343.1 hypothetical protein FNU76_19405 [Chitinimonas arctica]
MMNEGLLRQRRNLITTSILLWMMKFGEITALKKYNAVGFDFEFQNPAVLFTAIWIAFFYFLFRYFQYFCDEGSHKLRRCFGDEIEESCKPLIKEIVKQQYESSNDAVPYSFAFLKMNGWIYTGQLPNETEPGSSPPRAKEFKIEIKPWKLRKGLTWSILKCILIKSFTNPALSA